MARLSSIVAVSAAVVFALLAVCQPSAAAPGHDSVTVPGTLILGGGQSHRAFAVPGTVTVSDDAEEDADADNDMDMEEEERRRRQDEVQDDAQDDVQDDDPQDDAAQDDAQDDDDAQQRDARRADSYLM